MAEIAADFFLPSPPFVSHRRRQHLREDDDDLDILQDPAPVWPPFFSLHRDLEDPPREIDPDVFFPVFTPDLTPRDPFFSYDSDPDELNLFQDLFQRRGGRGGSVEGDEERPWEQEIRFFGEDTETGSGYLDQGCELGFECEKGSRAVEDGSGSDDGESKDGILEGDREGGRGGEVDLALHWDCLRIEEERRDLNEEFEWEEVTGAVLDREDSGLEGESFVEEEIEPVHPQNQIEEEDLGTRNIGWEVLLAVNGLDRSPLSEHEDGESYLGDEQDEGYVYTSDYDVLFGQFFDHENSIKGTPPASRTVVENLPSIFLTEEHVATSNALCAVCRDEVLAAESVKQLPCLHHYHRDCILPWLAVRNTCPVCRYELPTDDAQYEDWKARRGGSGGHSAAMLDFFPED